MRGPNHRTAVDNLQQPTFEENLRATANWMKAKSLPQIPGKPAGNVSFSAPFTNQLACWIDLLADMMEGKE